MRCVVWFATLLLLSSISFGSTMEPRVCHVQVNMSSGSLPQNMKLQLFAGGRRLSEMKVPFDGSLFLPPLTPGEYRVQTGEGTNFLTSGPMHVPELGACELRVSIVGHADAKNRLVEDDVDVEDLRVPAKARDQFEKGFAAFQHGDLEEATKDFLEVTKLDPKLSRAYNVLGVISDQQKNRAAARQYFAQALALNPHSRMALMNLAKLCMLEKRYDDALGFLERFRTGSREHADVYGMEADAYLKLGRYQEAIRAAQAAHRLSHQNWETVHLIAGQAYEALHQPEMAASEYRLYLDESSNPAMRAVAFQKVRELSGVAQQNRSAVPMNSLLPR